MAGKGASGMIASDTRGDSSKPIPYISGPQWLYFVGLMMYVISGCALVILVPNQIIGLAIGFTISGLGLTIIAVAWHTRLIGEGSVVRHY